MFREPRTVKPQTVLRHPTRQANRLCYQLHQRSSTGGIHKLLVQCQTKPLYHQIDDGHVYQMCPKQFLLSVILRDASIPFLCFRLGLCSTQQILLPNADNNLSIEASTSCSDSHRRRINSWQFYLQRCQNSRIGYTRVINLSCTATGYFRQLVAANANLWIRLLAYLLRLSDHRLHG
jgi:hypothetical protein